VADLPVGDNLQDHLMTAMDFHDNTTSAANIDKLASPLSFLEYITLGSGILSYSMACEHLVNFF
jgi:hypothetical protein